MLSVCQPVCVCSSAPQGVDVVAVHGDKDQEERTTAIAQFKAGTKDVLVATDVASKGLDFPGIQHVINYDMPSQIEDYVHRWVGWGVCGALDGVGFNACSRSYGPGVGVLVVESAALETAVGVITCHAWQGFPLFACICLLSVFKCALSSHARTVSGQYMLSHSVTHPPWLHPLSTGLGVRGVAARRVWPPPSSTRGSARRASCWTSNTCSRRRASGCPTSCRWVVVWGEA